MAKTVLRDVLNKINKMNLGSNVTSVNTGPKNNTDKLHDYIKKINDTQKSTENLYMEIVNNKKNVCLTFLYGIVSRFYFLKTQKSFIDLKNALEILKLLMNTMNISNIQNKLYELIALYFKETDDQNKQMILDQILQLLAQFGILSNILAESSDIGSKNYSMDPLTGETSVTTKLKFLKYITDENNTPFKMLAGRIEDDSMIAQETAVYIQIPTPSSGSGECSAIYGTLPGYDLVNLKFTKQTYAPLNIWPLNKWWKKDRYQSIGYEVENENYRGPEEKEPEYVEAHSTLYFNGARFTGGYIDEYKDVNVNSYYSFRFAKDSTKSNFLKNKVKCYDEYKKITTDLEFTYEDETDPSNNNRKSDNLSDGLNIKMSLDNYIFTGELSYDSSKSGTYTDADTGTVYNNVTAYNGSIAREIEDTEEESDSDFGEFSSSSINIDVFVIKLSSNRYKVFIKPIADDNANMMLYEMEDADTIALIAAASRTFENKSTNVVNMLTSTDNIALAINALNSLADNISNMSQAALSALLDKIFNMLNDSINSLKNDISRYINDILAYLQTFGNFDSENASFMLIYDKTYLSEIVDIFSSGYSNIVAMTDFDVNDISTYDICINTVNDAILSIDTASLRIIEASINSYNIIEQVISNLGPMMKHFISTFNFEQALDTSYSFLRGKSDTTSALASAGFDFKTMYISKSYKQYIEPIDTLMETDNYQFPILYLLREAYITLRKVKSSDVTIELYYDLYKNIIRNLYYGRFFTYSIVNSDFMKKCDDLYYIADMYNIPFIDNVDEFIINSDFIAISEDLIEFNNVSVSNILSLLAKNSTDLNNQTNILISSCNSLKPIIYKILDNLALDQYMNFFNNIIESTTAGARDNLNFRDLIIILTTYLVRNDIVDFVASNNTDKVRTALPGFVNLTKTTVDLNNIDNENELYVLLYKILIYIKYYSLADDIINNGFNQEMQIQSMIKM